MDRIVALQALATIIGEDDLRQRFMELTGFDAATLRARAGEPDMALAVAEFLGGHEPDLLRVASAIGVAPEQLR